MGNIPLFLFQIGPKFSTSWGEKQKKSLARIRAANIIVTSWPKLDTVKPRKIVEIITQDGWLSADALKNMGS